MTDAAKREELSDEDDFSDAALVRWLRTKYSRHGELEDKMAADRLEKLAAAIAGPFAWAKFEGDGSISLLTDEPFVDATPLYALAAPVSAQTPAGERERFERWAAALDEPRYENGDYKNDHVQTQWEAWQAALFAPPAQPSKVVAALQNMMGAFDTPIRRRKFPDDAFIKEAIESARAALAELGEGRS